MLFKLSFFTLSFYSAYSFSFVTKDCNDDDGLHSVYSHSYFISTVNDPLKPCRAVSDLELPVNVNYDIIVDLQSKRNSTPGIMFNIKDDNNYEMVYFRTGTEQCISTAAIIEGKHFEFDNRNCSKAINPRSSFNVMLKVRKKTFNVTIDEFGTFGFESRQPQDPSMGFIQGLGYQDLCGFNCEFSFMSLNLFPDTPAIYTIDIRGELHYPNDTKQNQLRVHRIDFHSVGRTVNTYCAVAFYFKEFNIGKAKLYIEGDSVHKQRDLKVYYSSAAKFNVFFHPNGEDLTKIKYRIMYHIMGCRIKNTELSFICDYGKYNSSHNSCTRSTLYQSRTTHYVSDATLDMGWYAFDSCSGSTMPTQSPGKNNICGSRDPVWLKLPEKAASSTNASVIGTACVYKSSSKPCEVQWDLPVYTCNSSVTLYYLVPTDQYTAYCAGDNDVCGVSTNRSEGSECYECRGACHKDTASSAKVIVGICVGCVVIGIIVLSVYLHRRCKRRKRFFSYSKAYRNVDDGDGLFSIEEDKDL